MDSSQTIRVMLVDDHNVVRSGLSTFLRVYDDLELVGEARNGLEAVNLCRQKKPDVILMDLMMPEMDGIEMCEQLKTDHRTSHIPLIMLTAKALIHATRPETHPWSDLTEREMEVLNLVVQGKSNQQIAESMFLSLATVKAHISKILSKLQVSSRAEAIAYAIKHKIVSL